MLKQILQTKYLLWYLQGIKIYSDEQKLFFNIRSFYEFCPIIDNFYGLQYWTANAQHSAYKCVDNQSVIYNKQKQNISAPTFLKQQMDKELFSSLENRSHNPLELLFIDDSSSQCQSASKDTFEEVLERCSSGSENLSEAQTQENPSKVEIPQNPEGERKKRRRIQEERLRRKKNQKHELEETVEGSWLKNFLAAFKNIFLDSIGDAMGKDYLEAQLDLRKIRDKNGITKSDYLTMFAIDDLREHWEEYFQSRAIYRDFELSKCQPQNKRIFARFAYRFEEVYRSGKFLYICPPNGKLNSEPQHLL